MARSAAHGLAVTDMIVEMDGPEPPIMDGSSIVYAKAGQRTYYVIGIQLQ
jgi:UDP-3-O-acyl-N-acetylglucosamine deacetylase